MSDLQRQEEESLTLSRMTLWTIPVVLQTLWDLLLHMTDS